MKLVKKFKKPAGALTGEILTANSTFGVDKNGYLYYNKHGAWYPTVETSRHYGDTYEERAMPYDPGNEFRSAHYPLSTIQAYGPGT